MDKILLVISSPSIRQLYHELLLDKQYEVVVVDNLAHALGFMAVDCFSKVVILSDGQADIELFLKVRKQKKNWKKTKLILLTDTGDFYKKDLRKNDVIITSLSNSDEVVRQVKKAIMA